MLGKVIIGKSWINGKLIKIVDIIKAEYDDLYTTEKGFIILKENVIKIE